MKEINITFYPDGSVEIDGDVFEGCDEIFSALKRGLGIENAPYEKKKPEAPALRQRQGSRYKV